MTTELTHEQATLLRAVKLGLGSWIDDVEAFVYENGDLATLLCEDGELSEDGELALAAYDAKWATVLREDLANAVSVLEAAIREHDELYEGRPNLQARMDEERRSLVHLRAILTGTA